MLIVTAWVVAYNVARFLSLSIQGLRDAVFVKVGQNAQRAIAVETFEHLHQLSLRYHLSRQTGGLARLVTRGTNAIEEFLRFLLFIIVPTFIQIAILCTWFTIQIWLALHRRDRRNDGRSMWSSRSGSRSGATSSIAKPFAAMRRPATSRSTA